MGKIVVVINMLAEQDLVDEYVMPGWHRTRSSRRHADSS
jgi:hypothetical protein